MFEIAEKIEEINLYMVQIYDQGTYPTAPLVNPSKNPICSVNNCKFRICYQHQMTKNILSDDSSVIQFHFLEII